MTKAVFHIPDDPDTIPVNETTKPDKWVVELIRDVVKHMNQERQNGRDSVPDMQEGQL